MSRYPHVAIRIATRLVPDGDCWIYTAGYAERAGHVQIHHGDRQHPVHRVVWELWFGPIPEGLCVCHRCDVPRCVNPTHLFLGTVADNNRDRDQKGRHVALRRGRNGATKVSPDTAAEIVRRYRAGGVSQAALASEYRVHQASIWRILRAADHDDTELAA